MLCGGALMKNLRYRYHKLENFADLVHKAYLVGIAVLRFYLITNEE